MITPTESIVKLFNNEKCKGCKYAVWVFVKPFYYITADGIKHRENKAALCRRHAEKSRLKCMKGYSISESCCEGND